MNWNDRKVWLKFWHEYQLDALILKLVRAEVNDRYEEVVKVRSAAWIQRQLRNGQFPLSERWRHWCLKIGFRENDPNNPNDIQLWLERRCCGEIIPDDSNLTRATGILPGTVTSAFAESETQGGIHRELPTQSAQPESSNRDSTASAAFKLQVDVSTLTRTQNNTCAESDSDPAAAVTECFDQHPGVGTNGTKSTVDSGSHDVGGGPMHKIESMVARLVFDNKQMSGQLIALKNEIHRLEQENRNK